MSEQVEYGAEIEAYIDDGAHVWAQWFGKDCFELHVGPVTLILTKADIGKVRDELTRLLA